MFDSLSKARRLAKRNPWKAEAYIATSSFPFGAFGVEKTLSANQYTVWGNPHARLNHVTHVCEVMRRCAEMVYALWDLDTNNLVAEYATLDEALELVLSGVKRNGPQDTDSLSLVKESDDGEVSTIAQGQALLDLAEENRSSQYPLAR